MEERYNRNRIYVSSDEQEMIRGTRILLAGAGIGSIIAECALRFGFENFYILIKRINKTNKKTNSGPSCTPFQILHFPKKILDFQYHLLSLQLEFALKDFPSP